MTDFKRFEVVLNDFDELESIADNVKYEYMDFTDFMDYVNKLSDDYIELQKKYKQLDEEVDDLSGCDDDANMEYFKRDAICGEVNNLLGVNERALELHDKCDIEYLKIMGKIEVLKQLKERIDEILD